MKYQYVKCIWRHCIRYHFIWHSGSPLL